MGMQCIKSVAGVLELNLRIPNYQRPYKWTQRNVTDLLVDVEDAMRLQKTKYRVGTLILHNAAPENTAPNTAYEIVDGQQRVLTFTLLSLALDQNFTSSILTDQQFQHTLFYDRISQKHLHDNFQILKEYVGSLSPEQSHKLREALKNILEFVVIAVDRETEAFQLFDSQNTRGKQLNPHDLLKAYHLREINDRYSMLHNTELWENAKDIKIRELFNWYLYPIMNWAKREKVGTFIERDIEQFKGVRASAGYRYGNRTVKAMPCFQLGEQFEAGECFFEMVSHYLRMREDVETEIMTNRELASVKNVLIDCNDNTTGFDYAKRLFYCAIMAYYDRFGIFNIRAISKLCVWAFTIRLDMDHLGFDTINKYAIGEANDRYSNCFPMFSIIKNSRSHLDIANIIIKKNNHSQRIRLQNSLNTLF